jgi:hypothetical protein
MMMVCVTASGQISNISTLTITTSTPPSSIKTTKLGPALNILSTPECPLLNPPPKPSAEQRTETLVSFPPLNQEHPNGIPQTTSNNPRNHEKLHDRQNSGLPYC